MPIFSRNLDHSKKIICVPNLSNDPPSPACLNIMTLLDICSFQKIYMTSHGNGSETPTQWKSESVTY